MTNTLNELIATEAKKLSKPLPRTYEQSFDPYRDSAGNVVWTCLARQGTPAPLQKWFKCPADIHAAVAKAKAVLAKAGHDGTFTVALEARQNILNKLAGK